MSCSASYIFFLRYFLVWGKSKFSENYLGWNVAICNMARLGLNIKNKSIHTVTVCVCVGDWETGCVPYFLKLFGMTGGENCSLEMCGKTINYLNNSKQGNISYSSLCLNMEDLSPGLHHLACDNHMAKVTTHIAHWETLQNLTLYGSHLKNSCCLPWFPRKSQHSTQLEMLPVFILRELWFP